MEKIQTDSIADSQSNSSTDTSRQHKKHCGSVSVCYLCLTSKGSRNSNNSLCLASRTCFPSSLILSICILERVHDNVMKNCIKRHHGKNFASAIISKTISCKRENNEIDDIIKNTHTEKKGHRGNYTDFTLTNINVINCLAVLIILRNTGS